MTDLVTALTDIVGSAHVLTDADTTAGHTVDWTGRFRGTTAAVVRPASTTEVALVVEACAEAGAPIVAQGGNTGLVGGSVPADGEVVLALGRLDRIEPVEAESGLVTAGAGVTIAALHAHVGAAGWAYGVDFSARDTATVGGTVATNAGGLRVLRYGDTRRQLRGIEAVLADGSVVAHLGGLEKDNTGYDLAGLLCGSEGTLGVVTAARLRLVAPAPERVVALLGFAAIEPAVAATGVLRRRLPSLEAAEVFVAAGLDLVCSVTGLAPPLPDRHHSYLLVECADRVDPTDELAGAVGDLSGVEGVAVATEAGRRAELWRYREAHTEAIATLGPPHKLDVTLPAPELALFMARVPDLVAAVAPEARCWVFGHAADGNVHVNVTGLDPDDEDVDDAVLRLVAALSGSISAEHGIGRAKKRWLELSRSRAELAAMRSVKVALDPGGILNPGVLF